MLFKLLLILIILSPLPFGSNREWAWSLLCLLTALLGIFWSLGMLGSKSKSNTRLWYPLTWPMVCYCLALAWAFLQTVPHLGVQEGIHPVWAMASHALQLDLPAYMSVSPYDTATAFMRLLAYGLVFMMSAHYCQESRNAKKLFQWVAFAGLCYAVYSLINHFGGYKRLLWYDGFGGAVSGTFVNKNTYATYAGLAILCCIPTLYKKVEISSEYGLSNNFGKQYFIETFIKQGWYVAINLFVSMTALFLTESRGGLISTLAALVGLLIVLAFLKQNQLKIFTYMALGVLGLFLLLFYISGDKVMGRFVIDESSDLRVSIYKATLEGIYANPWFGMGYGTFENSFRLYRNEAVTYHNTFAHNTYLENIFELGLPAALLLFAAIAMVAWKCLKVTNVRQKNLVYPAIGFSATILVATHSLVDFSLQIPAVAVTYAAILGAAFGQSIGSARRERSFAEVS